MTTLADWNLEKPTRANLIAMLAETLGQADAAALVDLAGRRCGAGCTGETPDELIRIAETLMEVADLVRVGARSAKVRAVTYRALSRVTPP